MNQAPRPRPATYQDVLDAPPHMVAELIRGALHLQPRPASRHAHASSVLGARIGSPFHYDPGGPGGWWILDEPELHLGPDVLVPDLAGWRRERMPVFPDAPWFELAPDWACEVLSPGTRRLDLTDKRDIYGAAGVGHLWLVDPKDRTLEAFALRDGAWVLVAALAGDAEVRLPPFEAIGFPLAALWPD
jgi:Uma2 family endonuclease